MTAGNPLPSGRGGCQPTEKTVKKTMISSAVNRAVNEVYVDKSGDAAFLAQAGEGWDDLTNLKNELATSMLTFMAEIESILHKPELLSMLGSNREEFDRLMNVFWADIDRFSKTMQTLRNQHENRSGALKSMEELNEFTRLSMQYQTLQVEMNSLLAPTMGSIVLILHEAVPQRLEVTPIQTQSEPESANVV